MGYYPAYENNIIIVYECDKCSKHCIIFNKKTNKIMHLIDKDMFMIGD